MTSEKREKYIIRKFMIYFDGVPYYVDPIAKSSTYELGLTDLKMIDENVLQVQLRRPGILIGKGGWDYDKLVEYFSKETAGQTNTLFKVLEPNEEEGTAVLALDKGDSEELYFYIQAIGARKVAVNQKKGSFLQTEYNCFEILDLVEGNYNQKFKSTIKNKKEGFLLKLEPNNNLNQYDYLLLYLTEEYLPQKIEFYQNSSKYKVWKVEEMGKNRGFYFPKKSSIVNLENNKQTEIKFKDVKYNLDVNDLYFSVRYLRR